MALDNYNDLRDYNRDTIVALNTDLTDFVYGDIKRLQEANANLDTGAKIMFMEFPSINPRDRDGSVDVKYSTGISILSNPNSELMDDQDTAMAENMEIAREILLRYRRDQPLLGHHFTINDVQKIDPVRLYTGAGWIGCRFEVDLGDWMGTALNAAKWTDI
jgi:hypothetical protein